MVVPKLLEEDPMPGRTRRFSPFKRRTLFIEKAFQLRFIAKVTLVVVLGTVLTGGLLYLLADQEFGRAFYSAHYQARSSWELLLPAVLVSSFVAMCFVAAVAVILTLYDSHRIGGPLYRFKANLKAVGSGDLTLLTRLREGDELQSLTAAMNEMTQNLGDKVRRIKSADDELRTLLCEARGNAESGGELRPEVVSRIEATEERLRRTLGEFVVQA
jgi:methyl-accepting chemotaxis protein